MTLYHVNAFDQDSVISPKGAQHSSSLTLILTGRHDDGISFANFHTMQMSYLDDLGSEVDDFLITSLGELTRDRTEHTVSARLLLYLVDKHDGVVVKADV